jgi:hypothetical protein
MTDWIAQAGIPTSKIFTHTESGIYADANQAKVLRFCGISPESTSPAGISLGLTTHHENAVALPIFSQLSALNVNWGLAEWNPFESSSADILTALRVMRRLNAKFLTPQFFYPGITHNIDNIWENPTIMQAIKLTLKQSFGDLNGSSQVDIFDYNSLVADWNKDGDRSSDINASGKVDIFDYNILVANFGKRSS